MLGLQSPHGDSHRFLFSAPLLNNLSPFFCLYLSFYLFFLPGSYQGRQFLCPLGWRGRIGLGGSPGAPSLFAQFPLFSAPGSEGEGARLRLQGVEPRGQKDQASWVTLLLWRLGPPGWLDPKV